MAAPSPTSPAPTSVSDRFPLSQSLALGLLGLAMSLPLIWPFDPGVVAKMGTTLVAAALWAAVFLAAAWSGLTPRFGLAALGFGVAAAVVGLQTLSGQLAYASQGAITVAVLLSAALIAGLGNAAVRRTSRAGAGMDPHPWLDVAAAGLLLQGVIQVVFGLVQFALWQMPSLASWLAAHAPLYADLISYPSTGRVFGNLRQPNHYATAVALGLAGLAWWAPRVRVSVVWAAVIGMSWALVVCGSRTGMVQAVVAAILVLIAVRGAWRDPRWAALVAVPVLYALWWLALREADHLGWISFLDAVTRQLDQPVNARALIWRNAWQVFEHLPWFGAGWGQLGWGLQHAAIHHALHPLPLDNIDNAHDLILQLLAETGLVGTLPIVIVALAWLWRSARGWMQQGRAAPNDASPIALTAWMGVAFLGLHSLVEYPLWYLYFLWVFAFLAGWMDGFGRGEAAPVALTLPRPAALAVGALAVALVAKAGYDYNLTNTAYSADRVEAAAAIRQAQRSDLFFRPLIGFAVASSLQVRAADSHAELLREQAEIDRVSHAYGDPNLLIRRILLLSRLGHAQQALALARYTASSFWLYAPGLVKQFPAQAAQAGLSAAQTAPLLAALKQAPVLRRVVVPANH
ncbi:putative O-Antigen Polymerase [Thiomonas sp. CB2]|nr:putative O-Antigen Polymerase [Thiomonas sp. CB2]VDY04229.1 putative O-Antigen Polymerase [Thiomonas sp. Bio17B3]VDY08597.1 putative O-Antigen Polymerase [Thiomonas sp. Sup16B3]VDY12476.1 putative O-Antigen Polymerase [Thiomonas sp. OC7]VDY18311.1 putative O-Antigen Polymerase [Thiomonas sp. CB2]